MCELPPLIEIVVNKSVKNWMIVQFTNQFKAIDNINDLRHWKLILRFQDVTSKIFVISRTALVRRFYGYQNAVSLFAK